jgi:hypothetical protein
VGEGRCLFILFGSALFPMFSRVSKCVDPFACLRDRKAQNCVENWKFILVENCLMNFFCLLRARVMAVSAILFV